MIESKAKYGAQESNPIPADYQAPDPAAIVDWSDPALERINRLRLISDPGFPFWDVSYCHGQLRDGTLVNVQLPFDQLPKRAVSRAIVEHAKACGVYAKRLGIFGAISTLV